MLLRAIISAFSMYSKIPMPRIEWDEKNMQYALCFFPLVGVVIGCAMYFIGSMLTDFNSLIRGCVLTVIPVLITGGIHFDGFLDTTDALCSYADKNKKLEIMNDPNVGAFAVIGGLIYFTLSVGFWSEADSFILALMMVVFVLSRTLSGLSVVSFPKAKKTGLAAGVSRGGNKKSVKFVLYVCLLLEGMALCVIDKIGGFTIILTIIICYICHYRNCVKNFGGITGDLAGYFLQMSELMSLIVCVIYRKLML